MGHAQPTQPQHQPPAVDMPALIRWLEARDRDALGVVAAPPLAALGRVPFVHIGGLAAFWRAGDEPDLLGRLEDLLAALNGTTIPLHFLLAGRGGRVAFYVGLEADRGDEFLRPLLTALLPGALPAEQATPGHAALPAPPAVLVARGVLTGIPTRRAGAGGPRPDDRPTGRMPATGEQPSTALARPDQIERLIRGMQGFTWGWWVRAAPIPQANVAVETDNLLNTLTLVQQHVKQQYQRVGMRTRQPRPNESEGETTTTSNETVNAQAEYAVALLQKQRDRYDRAKALGMWSVGCQAFADQPVAVERLLALLRAAFGGPDSAPESIRTHMAREASGPMPTTTLTTPELATLAQLPQQEFQGFRIAPYARFDTDPPTPPPATPFPIGNIIDGERDTGASFAVDQNDLAKHALVAGMTGSGKTTTVFNILLNLRARNLSFLVIEPAKAEYRDLLGASSGGRPTGPVADLRVFTLGDETVAPFRLNPFEFDVMSVGERVHVQTHIDYLKAVFNAAFILYAPMPYVLEMCLHEIYTDAGWDLATGLNSRLATADYAQIAQWPIFPTLGDLYHKFDEVVDRLGYEDRIAMDVKAGLKARVGALMLGSKGLMLNCRRGLSMVDLLAHPTVLELERIGNDDEKAFIIGLVMARLYEFRRLQAAAGGRAPFRHLTVIEEAHRLLKNVSTDVPVEGANTRGQAVETFANMLSEVRSYGQGFLIAEQIPTKLTPDALKNTNLKIVHRLAAADEREIIAGATNMNAEQAAHLSTLRSGHFVAYGDQADQPYLLTVADMRRARIPRPTTDEGVRAAMSDHTQTAVYEPVRGYWAYVAGARRAVNPYRFTLAERVLENPHFDEAWAVLLLHIVRDPAQMDEARLAELHRLVRATTGALEEDERREVTRIVVALAVDRAMNRRGRLYRWSYSTQHRLHDRLLTGVMALADGQTSAARAALVEFVRDYRTATALPEGPFVGCAPCRVRCWLRPDMSALAAQPGLRQEMAEARQGRREREAHEEMATLAMSVVRRAAGEMPREAAASVALCLLAHLTARLGLSRADQADTAAAAQLLLVGRADSPASTNP